MYCAYYFFCFWVRRPNIYLYYTRKGVYYYVAYSFLFCMTCLTFTCRVIIYGIKIITGYTRVNSR